jgi:acyl carrier protein
MELEDLAPIIIAAIKNVPVQAVVLRPELDIIDDLGFDSLEITELLYSVEEVFGVSIPYEQLAPDDLRSLSKLQRFLGCRVRPDGE